MKLYEFYRSSAAYRVRIALALKGLDPERIHVDILVGGEQHSDRYGAVNPQQLVPSLETDDGLVLTQSLAIVEYLDEIAPSPPLLPADPAGRALARAIAQAIACDIHPFGAPRVAQYLKNEFGRSDRDVAEWTRHWILTGLVAVDGLIDRRPGAGPFAVGDRPSLADIALVPQVVTAERLGVDLSGCRRIAAVVAACRQLPAFTQTAPERQPEAA